MRKVGYLFLFMFLIGCLNAKAQLNVSDVQEVNYYGIDFSKVKIFRAQESAERFQTTFKAINELTLIENKKYNFGKFFKKSLETKSFAIVNQRNMDHAPTMLPLEMSSKQLNLIKLSTEDMKEVIHAYGNEDNGVGVVIIAVLLNKNKVEAVYDVVFFDVKTKEIIFNKTVVGKAGGAGLRNFWANSVYNAVKKWKYNVQ